MKFTTILSVAFSFTFAYGQFYGGYRGYMASTNSGAISYFETNQAPDVVDTTNVNTAEDVAAQEVTGNMGDAGITLDDGEVSEGYGDVNSINSLDAGDISDNGDTNEDANAVEATNNTLVDPQQPIETPIFTGPPEGMASNQASSNTTTADASKDSTQNADQTPTVALDDKSKKDNTIDTTKIASSLVGAAVLSSVGVFVFLKRSKRRGLESVRSQISMA